MPRSKFLSLRELRQLFTNSIALTDHVVVFEAIIEEKEQHQIFSWPGPRWSSPGGFLFHCNTWDRHFFYRHKLLTFFERESTTVSHCEEAADRFGCSLEITREDRDWKYQGRACNILLTAQRLEWATYIDLGPYGAHQV